MTFWGWYNIGFDVYIIFDIFSKRILFSRSISVYRSISNKKFELKSQSKDKNILTFSLYLFFGFLSCQQTRVSMWIRIHLVLPNAGLNRFQSSFMNLNFALLPSPLKDFRRSSVKHLTFHICIFYFNYNLYLIMGKPKFSILNCQFSVQFYTFPICKIPNFEFSNFKFPIANYQSYNLSNFKFRIPSFFNYQFSKKIQNIKISKFHTPGNKKVSYTDPPKMS